MSLLTRITTSLRTGISSLSHTIQYRNPQRNYWREILRSKPDPKNPSRVLLEDPEQMAMRSARAQNAEGLLRRRRKYIRYEKPWMVKKRLKMARTYKSMEKGVNDLKAYVKYINEANQSVR